MLENTGDAERCIVCGEEPRFLDGGWCISCMSRRDTFATAALTGMLANETIARAMKVLMAETGSDPAVMHAEMAYEYADAMLEVRKAGSK